MAFADAGIYRDAIRMWKKVVELAPGSPEAVSAKESIEVLEKFVTSDRERRPGPRAVTSPSHRARPRTARSHP